jgi:hypothetical protein
MLDWIFDRRSWLATLRRSIVPRHNASAKRRQKETAAMQLLWMILLIGLCGCGQAAATMAGGKPVCYWVEAIHSPDAKLRKEAVFKLGNVGPADAAAFSALQEALRDADAAVRCEAILAMLKGGPAAQEAVPILTEMREHDRDAKVREYAGKALEKLR